MNKILMCSLVCIMLLLGLGVSQAHGQSAEHTRAERAAKQRAAAIEEKKRAERRLQMLQVAKAFGEAVDPRARCDAGQMDACAEIEQRAQDLSRLIASCDANDPQACFLLGQKYSDGAGVKANKKLASQLYARACDSGHQKACASLASAYFNGNGVTRNYAIANGVAERACDLNDAEKSVVSACAIKGDILAEGLGQRPNYQLAMSYSEQACRMGSQKSCLRVAKSLRLGYVAESNGTFPIAMDAARAKQLAGAACEQRNAAGCYELAQLNSHEKASYARYMARSCDYGSGSSCFELAKAMDTGRAQANASGGVQTLEYYRSAACRLNTRSACSWKSKATLAREAAELQERQRLAALEKQRKQDAEEARMRKRIAEWKRTGNCNIFDVSYLAACLAYQGVRTDEKGLLADMRRASQSAQSSGAYDGGGSNQDRSSRRGQSSASSRNRTNKTGGFTITETISYSRGQKVIARGRCSDNTRFNVEYYPNNGASSRYYIYSASGSSIEDVARKFCRNH